MKNKLILGTVQFGLPYGINNQRDNLISEKEVHEIFRRALCTGINILDTAAVYGEAESRIGSFHNENKKFKVITKFSKAEGETWKNSLNESLNRMNLESVETVMFHSFEAFMQHRKTLTEINSARGSLFKKLGVSVYNNKELMALKDIDEVEVVQLPFNLLDNDHQRGKILKELKKSGKEIHTRSCFLQGLFFMDEKILPEKLKPLTPWLGIIKKIAKGNNIEIGHLALQYVLDKNYIDGVLFGVDSLKQLDQNYQWTIKKLPKEIFLQIDKIKVSNPELLNPSQWQIKR